MVLRHVAPILLGSAFLGMKEGRAVFLGRISLNYLILILLFVKTFALNFTQKQTFVLCVLHLCSAKSVSWANIWKGTTRARQRNEDQPTVFSYSRSASVFRNLAVEHTFCTGFVILFEIVWNTAPSHSHSLSHTLHILYIFYVQAKTWYHLHLSVRNADNSDITILPTRIIFVLPAGPVFSLIDTVGRRWRRNCPSRRWLDKSKRSINAVTDPPVGFPSWDEEVQAYAWCMLEQLKKV